MWRQGIAIATVTGVAGCALVPRSLDPPPNDQATVALLTGTLPEPLDDVARHPWFAVRAQGAGEWTIRLIRAGHVDAPSSGHMGHMAIWMIIQRGEVDAD